MLYVVCGHQVCCVAWQAVYGITTKSLSKTWKRVKSGICQIEPHRCSRQSQKTDVAVAWIKLFVQRIGDRMPDGVVINLPSFMNLKLLHNYMSEDLSKEGDSVISYTQFYYIMKNNFPDVHIPKVKCYYFFCRES